MVLKRLFGRPRRAGPAYSLSPGKRVYAVGDGRLRIAGGGDADGGCAGYGRDAGDKGGRDIAARVKGDGAAHTIGSVAAGPSGEN